MNHPLFEKFLKEAKKEYRFNHKGRISIPCHVSDFQYVQEVIHRENHESHAHVNCFGSLPLFLRVWWPLSLTLCLCTVIKYKTSFPTTYGILKALCVPALTFLCFVALRGSLGIQRIMNSELQEPLLLEDSNGEENVTPYSAAGLVSTVTLLWLNLILAVGYRRVLELKDVPALAPKDRAENAYKVLTDNWAKLKAANPEEHLHHSLAKAIVMSFWREALRNGVFAGVNTVVS